EACSNSYSNRDEVAYSRGHQAPSRSHGSAEGRVAVTAASVNRTRGIFRTNSQMPLPAGRVPLGPVELTLVRNTSFLGADETDTSDHSAGPAWPTASTPENQQK